MGDAKSLASPGYNGLAEQLNIPVRLPKAEVLRQEEVDVAFVVDQERIGGSAANWANANDTHRGLTLRQSLRMVEARTLNLPAANELDQLACFESRLHQVLKAGAIPVAIHTDQLGSLSAIRPFASRFDKPGAVIFALDSVGQSLMEVSVADTVIDAVEAGFNPANCVVAGLSGWCRPPANFERMKALGVHTISLEEIWSDGLGELNNRIVTVAGKGSGAILVSFDMRRHSPDVIDYGVTSRDLFRLLQNLNRIPVRGIDLCLNDSEAGLTPGFALPLAFEVLSQIATREGKCRRVSPSNSVGGYALRARSA